MMASADKNYIFFIYLLPLKRHRMIVVNCKNINQRQYCITMANNRKEENAIEHYDEYLIMQYVL